MKQYPTAIRLGAGIRLATAICALALAGIHPEPALAEVELVKSGDFTLTTSGRVNAFISFSSGTQVPETQPHPDSFDQYPGAGTDDEPDRNDKIQAFRVRNGFLPSIIAFDAKQQVNDNYRASMRVGLWMNAGAGRTKNIPGPIDPRELWVQVEGPWGQLRGGSDLALFGRGGILLNYEISHAYGLGYPCTVENTAGGSCGHVAFGAPFPGFEPGIVYTTPNLAGIELAVGVYDPTTIQNSRLTRTPLPRFEGELSFAFKDTVKLFANAHWQLIQGLWQLRDEETGVRQEDQRDANAWGAQAGGMATIGPIQLGAAAFMGAGITPFTHVGEDLSNGDAEGKLRESMGAFAMSALNLESIGLKIAAGVGLMEMEKTENDKEPVVGELVSNPQVFRSNVGGSFGLYQQAGPVYFALEYFRAEHEWYEEGIQRDGRENLTSPGSDDPNNLVVIDIRRPRQAVNFINAGMTFLW